LPILDERTPDSAWPDLHVATWPGTKRSLHMYAQMLGKIRLALSPPQPNWLFTALYLTPQGMTTGFIPYGAASVEVWLDVFDSRIAMVRSSGERSDVSLVPVRTVADVYAELDRALKKIDVGCVISTIPQEVPDQTPLDEDRRPSEYDPQAAQRWFRAVTAVAGEFERWRAQFFGRSGIQLWWGAFDISILLFSGRRVTPPANRGYLMKYDLDAELMNVGLYLGDENNAPLFYGYIYPEPPGAERLAIEPPAASWSNELREWVLPYESVRNSDDPRKTIRGFVDAIYQQCFAAAGWDRNRYVYDLPTRMRERR